MDEFGRDKGAADAAAKAADKEAGGAAGSGASSEWEEPEPPAGTGGGWSPELEPYSEKVATSGYI